MTLRIEGIEVEDPAKFSMATGAYMRELTMWVALHDTAHKYANLNLDEVTKAALNEGAERAAAPKAVARTEKGAAEAYATQAVIILKQKVFPLMVKGRTGDSAGEAVRQIAKSLSDALKYTGWKVLEGKEKALKMQSRAQQRGRVLQSRGSGPGAAGKGKGKGPPEAGATGAQTKGKGKGQEGTEGTALGKGKGRPRRATPADAVAVVIGTNASLRGKAVVPARLAVLHPSSGDTIILNGRAAEADFRISGQSYFEKLGPGYPDGFYDTKVGTELKEEVFLPKTAKGRMEAEALAMAVEEGMGGAPCKLYVQKATRRAEGGYICNAKKKCPYQPCLQAAADPNFTTQPLMRLFSAKFAEVQAKADQERKEQAELATALAKRKLRHLEEKQREADEELERAKAADTAAAEAAAPEATAAAAATAPAPAEEVEEEALEEAEEAGEEADAALPDVDEMGGMEVDPTMVAGLPEIQARSQAWWRVAYFTYQAERWERQETEYCVWSAITDETDRELAKSLNEQAAEEKPKAEANLVKAKEAYLSEEGDSGEVPALLPSDYELGIVREIAEASEKIFESILEPDWTPPQAATPNPSVSEAAQYREQPASEASSKAASTTATPKGTARVGTPAQQVKAAPGAGPLAAAAEAAAAQAAAAKNAAAELQAREEEEKAMTALAEDSSKRKSLYADKLRSPSSVKRAAELAEAGGGKATKGNPKDGDALMDTANELGLGAPRERAQPPGQGGAGTGQRL